MHTIQVEPSDPIRQSDLTTTTVNSILGVKEDAMAISQDAAVTPPEEPVNTSAPEDCATTEKPVVTPEGPKSTASVATASTTGEDPTLSSIEDGSVSSPLTPPRVHSVFSSKDQLIETTKTEANRNRILSLDRATANYICSNMIEVDAFAADTNGNANIHSTNNFQDDEENSSQADSSDGESSYFAKHLPSPKSGRRFSYSSNHSAPARTSSSSLYKGADNNRPSDASLSFSDESDDDELPHPSESPEPVSQLPNQVADMQIQRITRVHSVSSLVSSEDDASSHGHVHAGGTSPNSTLSCDSYGSTSDNAELSTVVASTVKRNKPFEGASPSGFTQASPPNILPGYNATGPNPGPQMMTPGQLASWATSQQHNQHKMFGAGKPAAASTSSDCALPFVYSDDETDDPPFMQQLAGSDGGYSNTNGPYNTYPNSHTGAPDDGFGVAGEGQRGGGKGNDGACQQPRGQTSYGYGSNGVTSEVNNGGGGDGIAGGVEDDEDDGEFQVYWRRWLMLFYMSILNLLSDWVSHDNCFLILYLLCVLMLRSLVGSTPQTCYSVAPLATLFSERFGAVDPERLVVIFLGANAIATACEPIILARLGLRKTVLFGALLLMIGSMIKSGGIPPIIGAELVRGRDEWRLSLGFFLVGLSQPLYQCTPALLSASWFPERERTMATGVALNANQLGIGCAFVFGTLLVAESDDIPGYFSLLSIISTLCFLGTLLQFDDAPPTPPSSSAKVMKGDMTVPDMGSIVQSIRKSVRGVSPLAPTVGKAAVPMNKDSSGSTRRRSTRSPAPAPSPALWGKTEYVLSEHLLLAPSPMMPGPVDPSNSQGARDRGDNDESPLYSDAQDTSGGNFFDGQPGGYPMQPRMPYGAFPPPPYQNPYMDPRMHQQPPYYQQQPYFYPPPPPPHPYYYGYQNAPPLPPGMYPHPLPPPPYAYGGYAADFFEEGAEPIITVTDHHLDISTLLPSFLFCSVSLLRSSEVQIACYCQTYFSIFCAMKHRHSRRSSHAFNPHLPI